MTTPASTLLFYTHQPVHLVNGWMNGPWYGSFWPDAPAIFETDASLDKLWSGPRRLFLLTYHPDVRTPDLARFGPVHTLASAGGEIHPHQPAVTFLSVRIAIDSSCCADLVRFLPCPYSKPCFSRAQRVENGTKCYLPRTVASGSFPPGNCAPPAFGFRSTGSNRPSGPSEYAPPWYTIVSPT